MEEKITVKDSHIEELFRYRFKEYQEQYNHNLKDLEDKVRRLEDDKIYVKEDSRGTRKYVGIDTLTSDIKRLTRQLEDTNKKIKTAEEDIQRLSLKNGALETVTNEKSKALTKAIRLHNSFTDEIRSLLWYQAPKNSFYIKQVGEGVRKVEKKAGTVAGDFLF